jgi:hypothetical protein
VRLGHDVAHGPQAQAGAAGDDKGLHGRRDEEDVTRIDRQSRQLDVTAPAARRDEVQDGEQGDGERYRPGKPRGG